MKATIWTVSTHGSTYQLPSETKVFSTKPEAQQYLVDIIEMAGSRGYCMSSFTDPDGSDILELFYEGKLMFVSIMRCHEIEIPMV